ncbi:MAG: hypothetical protein K0S07_302 [Chlamydiales bacterium]|jgi:hypothetical protein|nr:hypothetical protein [Chlamydiales bacterium]
MFRFKNSTQFIIDSIPLLTPAVEKEKGAWQKNSSLLIRRVYLIAVACLATVATFIAAVSAAISFAYVGVLSMPLITAFAISWLDHRKAKETAAIRNVQEFIFEGLPSTRLVKRRAPNSASLKEANPFKVKLEKALCKASDDSDRLTGTVDVLFEQAALPIKRQILLKTTENRGQESSLQQLLNLLSEDELLSLKEDPEWLKKFVWQMVQPTLPFAVKAQMMFQLEISYNDIKDNPYNQLEAVVESLAREFKNISSQNSAEKDAEIALWKRFWIDFGLNRTLWVGEKHILQCILKKFERGIFLSLISFRTDKKTFRKYLFLPDLLNFISSSVKIEPTREQLEPETAEARELPSRLIRVFIDSLEENNESQAFSENNSEDYQAWKESLLKEAQNFTFDVSPV